MVALGEGGGGLVSEVHLSHVSSWTGKVLRPDNSVPARSCGGKISNENISGDEIYCTVCFA